MDDVLCLKSVGTRLDLDLLRSVWSARVIRIGLVLKSNKCYRWVLFVARVMFEITLKRS